MKKSGFTLVEMLTVIVLIGLLMGASGLALRKANTTAKRTKAEGEMRELSNALLQYHLTYNGWNSSGLEGLKDKDLTIEMLAPITDSNNDKNPRKIVFFQLDIPSGNYNDPWGNPYLLTTDSGNTSKRLTALKTSVSFPYRHILAEDVK